MSAPAPRHRRLNLSPGHPTDADVEEVEALTRWDPADGGRPPLVVELATGPARSAAHPDVASWTRWEKALVKVERLPVPTVGSVDGPVRGAALQFLLALDFRAATPSSELSCTEVREGHLPGMALYRLTRLLGLAGARRVALSGVGLTAGEAAALGLVDAVGEDRAALVDRLLAGVPHRPGSSWKLARRLLHESTGASFENALGGLLAAQDRVFRETAPPG